MALPFWLHRLQTESSDRKPFSSAMLLETSEQRIHVRKKLRYFTLLALRVLCLALLAFAFGHTASLTVFATLSDEPSPDHDTT